METKYWNGKWPASCDECKEDLSKKKVFFDARTISGYWSLLCNKCFHNCTYGKIGAGYGQKYDSKTLMKLEG